MATKEEIRDFNAESYIKEMNKAPQPPQMLVKMLLIPGEKLLILDYVWKELSKEGKDQLVEVVPCLATDYQIVKEEVFKLLLQNMAIVKS